MTIRCMIRKSMAMISAIVIALTATIAHASDPQAGIGVRHVSLIDETRQVKASNGFAGSPVRRIDVTIWYPIEAGRDQQSAEATRPVAGNHPLVIYSHGSYGRADNALHLVNSLVSVGYIVAAPDYPLSSRAAYTKISGIDISDVANQTRDVHFILDQLLKDKDLAPLIDKEKIATIGHSLGAVSSYFTSFGSLAYDPRIKATVLMGAGDPVQAALATDMGLIGNWNLPSHVPVLFLSADHDVFALINGRPHSAYDRLINPKYEITVKGGVHIWFRDGSSQPADGSNPDCAMLSGFRPGTVLDGCEKGAKLNTPLRQQEITRVAVRDFLDGYLMGDKEKLRQLRDLPRKMHDIEELSAE